MTATLAADARRVPATDRPPSRGLLLLEGRALPELGAFLATAPLLTAATPRGDGHPVLVLPGLVASDLSTVAMRSWLRRKNYAAYGWELGPNRGFRPHLEQDLLDKIKRIADQHGRKLSLVGWSLGGIFARQLAKEASDHVRAVVTLGSPFAGPPKATNAWRVYELASGTSVDEAHLPHFAQNLEAPPPTPATAIVSRTDGVCPWQNCMEQESDIAENIEVYASHCGLGHHPAALFALGDRLAQPEGAWRKFDRSGWRSVVFPDPYRGE